MVGASPAYVTRAYDIICDASEQRIEHLGRFLIGFEEVAIVSLAIDRLRHGQQQRVRTRHALICMIEVALSAGRVRDLERTGWIMVLSIIAYAQSCPGRGELARSHWWHAHKRKHPRARAGCSSIREAVRALVGEIWERAFGAPEMLRIIPEIFDKV